MPVFTPDPDEALFNDFTGTPFEDPVDYSTPNQVRVDSKFFLVPIQDEVLNLIRLASQGGFGYQVHNSTGGTLVKGTVGYISGYDTGSGKLKIDKAKADSVLTPAMAVLDADLLDTADGVAYSYRDISGFDTSLQAVGDKVYLSDTVAGEVTFTAPSGVDVQKRYIGAVLTVNALTGSIRFFIGANVNEKAVVELTPNLISNSGMDLHQRQIPGTATACNDNTLGPDRFVVLCQNASCKSSRSTGSGSLYAGKLTQDNATTGGVGYLQIVPGDISTAMRSKSVIASVRVKANANVNARINIIQWTGTIDSFGAARDVVNDWTGAGAFIKTTTQSVIATVQVALASGVWTDIDVQGDVASNINNLLLLISSDGYDGVSAGGLPQNGTLEVSQVSLHARLNAGVEVLEAPMWSPRTASQELDECLSFYEKSFAPDTNPVTNSGINIGAAGYYTAVAGVHNDGVFIKFHRIKRIIPTMTYLNPQAANNKWRNITIAADSAAAATEIVNQSSVIIKNPQVVGDNAGDFLVAHWTAESEIT